MSYSEPKFGLVLAGGGAKGAYQVGVLQYIAEIGLHPHIIAGTSIGALNAAILVSSSNFFEGVRRLNELWNKLGQANIIRPSLGTVAKVASHVARVALPTFPEWVIEFLKVSGIIEDMNCIFDPKPIEAFLREAVNPVQLRNGIELWVAAFPSLQIPGVSYDLLMDLLITGVDLFRARMGTKAHWLRIQDAVDDEMLYTLLLASAAIPLAFPQRSANGQSYVDGALADNVPLGALAAQGITHAIVIHLGNGSVWNRHDFPDQTIVEIRPVEIINKSNTALIGDVLSLLDFNSQRISLLKKRGYEDAKYHLEPIRQTLLTVKNQRENHESLIKNTQRLLSDEAL